MKKLFTVLIMMSLVSFASLAYAGTEDDNNQEAEPVYFGFMFDVSCSDENPCTETDEENEDEADEESEESEDSEE
jgi:hypothetical protein